MVKFKRIVTVATVICSIKLVSVSNIESSSSTLDVEKSKSLAHSSLAFAWNAYKALEIPAGHNVFYSPYSIINAFGMLILGSKGELQAQLKAAFGQQLIESIEEFHWQLFDENEKLGNETEATVSVANRFFVDDALASKVNRYYETDLSMLYNSELVASPFAKNAAEAQLKINEFVSRQTRGEISKLLEKPPSPRTILMLVNAIYFKGMWTTPFKERYTKPGEFTVRGRGIDTASGAKNVSTDFMWIRTTLDYAHNIELKAEMIAIPYTENRRYAFHAIIPDNQSISLQDLEARLDAAKIRNFFLTKLEPTHIELRMPKFAVNGKFKLNSMMEKLGATGVSEPWGMENSRIFLEPIEGTFVDEVFHEAKITVNENGTVNMSGN